MHIEIITVGGKIVASISTNDKIITDTASAMDLIMSTKYGSGASRIAINKEAIADEFFILSSGLAGEVLQKFVNYHIKLAIYGDFSGYTSKPLHDFIYESNKGKDIFFMDTMEQAVDKLLEV